MAGMLMTEPDLESPFAGDAGTHPSAACTFGLVTR